MTMPVGGSCTIHLFILLNFFALGETNKEEAVDQDPDNFPCKTYSNLL